MKKFFITSFVGLLIISSLSGCGKSNQDEKNLSKNETNTESNEKNNDENNDEEASLNDVEILFPSSAFEGFDEDRIKKGAALMGARAVINDDGTVTYLMSQRILERETANLKESLTENCNALTDENSSYPFIKEVTLNEDLTSINVKVNKEEFEAANISFSEIVKNCLAYQCFKGVELDNLTCVVHFIDESNDTEFKTENYDKSGKNINE